ncbi:NAD(P)-dependent oxidoreductase [Curtobacterium sp. ZW137]|uniref:NAD(P)-dependent oxidoreductase n=1 Tax=Curtobacterium sp. ZW137 TaxID=2485104 RepID=UPI000F4B73CF|nr:NAD(P)-binding oxidoreductase [Curtobacterium sp. ZW137]ROP66491.1 putative NADH-flavin reductase [Curtobacterium sp. ZW137]
MTTTPRTRIIVLGAGGRTGRLVLESALHRGHQAVALVRSPERANLAARDGLEVIAADARDARVLRSTLRPGDVIVSAVGPSGRKSNGLYSAVARAVVDATVGGSHRFVGITSSGVRDDDPNHPWWYRSFMVPFMENTYGDMRQMESTLRASDLPWTFVRPGRLLDEAPSGNYRIEDGENPKGGISISRKDVADFVISCADNEHWTRRNPTITT